MRELPEHGAFVEHLGTTFKLQADEPPTVDLELIEADPLPSARSPSVPNGIRKAPFSLVFRAARGVALPQRVYRLVHPSLGDMELFLVPIGVDERGVRYEAVFN